MKVLIACEFSGTVRKAFHNKGHDVTSCDIISSQLALGELPAGKHVVCDVLELLNDGWELMIAHPPCTYLSYAGTRWWHSAGREKKRNDAVNLFMQLWNAPIPKICIENPLGVISNTQRHSQIVNPYEFGEPFRKRTCLWLKNLDPLVPTDLVQPIDKYFSTGRKAVSTDITTKGTGVVRQRERSRFWKGIATAMADQWG